MLNAVIAKNVKAKKPQFKTNEQQQETEEDNNAIQLCKLQIIFI